MLLRVARTERRAARAASVVNPLAAPQQGEVGLDPPRARPRALGVVDPPDDRVPVASVEAGEGGRGRGIRVELALQVLRHRGRARAFVRGVPAAVGTSTIDL